MNILELIERFMLLVLIRILRLKDVFFDFKETWEGHSSRCFLILVEDNTVKLCLQELHSLEQDFSQCRINYISGNRTHSGFV